jgi:hypothetical protein
MKLYSIVTNKGVFQEYSATARGAIIKVCVKHQNDDIKLRIVNIFQMIMVDLPSEEIENLHSKYGDLIETKALAESPFYLNNAGKKKLLIVKTLVSNLGIGLKDAKDIVDSVPTIIDTKELTDYQIRKMKEELQEAGADVIIHVKLK